MAFNLPAEAWYVIGAVGLWMVISILSIIGMRLQHGRTLHDLTVRAHELRRERLQALYKRGGAELLSEYASDAGEIMAGIDVHEQRDSTEMLAGDDPVSDSGSVEILQAA